jgi:hypothetical protein
MGVPKQGTCYNISVMKLTALLSPGIESGVEKPESSRSLNISLVLVRKDVGSY